MCLKRCGGGGWSAGLSSRWLRGWGGERGWRGRRWIIVCSLVGGGVVEPRQHGRSDAIVHCSSRAYNFFSRGCGVSRVPFPRGAACIPPSRRKRDSIHICCRAACGSAVAPAMAGWGTCLAAPLQTTGPSNAQAGRPTGRGVPGGRRVRRDGCWPHKRGGGGGERAAAPARWRLPRSWCRPVAPRTTPRCSPGRGRRSRGDDGRRAGGWGRGGLLERPPSDASTPLTLCPPLSVAAPPRSHLVSPTAACHPATGAAAQSGDRAASRQQWLRRSRRRAAGHAARRRRAAPRSRGRQPALTHPPAALTPRGPPLFPVRLSAPLSCSKPSSCGPRCTPSRPLPSSPAPRAPSTVAHADRPGGQTVHDASQRGSNQCCLPLALTKPPHRHDHQDAQDDHQDAQHDHQEVKTEYKR